MNMQPLQAVVCRGAVDAAFMLLLACAPTRALDGFELSDAEQDLLARPPARSLEDIALRVETWRFVVPPQSEAVRGEARHNEAAYRHKAHRYAMPADVTHGR